MKQGTRVKSSLCYVGEVGVVLIAIVPLTLVGCGGGVSEQRVGPVANPITFGGTVAGLNAGNQVVLRLQHHNWAASGTIATNGVFAIEQINVASPLPYSLTVASQPAGQNCSVTNGSGEAIPETTISNMIVDCSSSTYNVAVTVSGVIASGSYLVMGNGTDSLLVRYSDITYNLNTPLTSGSPYAVTVQTQPAGQTCTVFNGNGVINIANIGVTVECL